MTKRKRMRLPNGFGQISKITGQRLRKPYRAMVTVGKTFITRAKAAGMNDYALKRIVGHYIEDITEAVYTERPPSWLRAEMKKIK